MGEFAGKFVDEILAPHALVNLRKAQAVIRLGEKHGANKLDDVCRYLLANGSTRHSSVKRLLEQGIPQTATAPTPPQISDAGRELLHPADSFGEVSL